MNSQQNTWTKTLLSAYSYLENICGSIDKKVLNYGISSGCSRDTEYVANKILSLMNRKKFLINTKVMVDSVTGNGPMKIPTGPGEYILRFRKGAKLVPTGRNLTYSSPQAVPKWFEHAKARNKDFWISGVREIIVGGRS